MAQSPQNAPNAPARRVVVIDDEVPICRVVKRALGAENVVSFTDPILALDWLTHGNAADAILCDLTMPQMSGIEVYQRLRAAVPDAAERVVFLTGGAVNREAHDFLASVPNQVIEKPFELETLRAVYSGTMCTPE